MKMVVYLRGGAHFEVDVTEVSTKRSIKDGGGLSEINWKTPESWSTKLHTVDPSEIVAVVMKREEGDDE